MGMGLFMAALLLLLARVDGVRRDGLMPAAMADAQRNHLLSEGDTFVHDFMDAFAKEIPSSRDVPPDFFCHSCQEVSRKAEKFLTDPSLYQEVDTFSTELCQILRSDLQLKCRRLMELYLREGILFLQIIFLEKNLCNSTGFCIADNSTTNNSTHSLSSTDHGNVVTPLVEPNIILKRKMEKKLRMAPQALNKINVSPFKVGEGKSCDACHVATERLRKDLQDHEQQIKIIKSILEACESTRNYANQCKTFVFQYGPLLLANLQKLLSSKDVCHLTHVCKEPVPPKGKTDPMYLDMEESLEELHTGLDKMFVL